MKKRNILSTIFLAFGLFVSCEDQIYPDLKSADPIMVIDAWINNLPKPQTIRLTLSQAYFDNTVATGVEGATVYVTDNEGLRYDFISSGEGIYTWTPPENSQFGKVGNFYNLHIATNTTTFTSTSPMNRSTPIDSITFKYEEESESIEGDDYRGEFFATDSLGPGDTYWIKAFKNGQLLNKPSEINIAFDAGFSSGGNSDGVPFISPIRNGVNPFDKVDGKEDVFYPPYADGDELYVEVHSINPSAFNYLNEVSIQTNRTGGFAEFFARPLSNIESNIVSSDADTDVLGFFCVSAVEYERDTLDVSEVPKEN